MRRKTRKTSEFYTFSGALLPEMGKIIQHSKVKMSGRLPWESDEEYFRRMVHAHKPVNDIVPSPDPQPLSGIKWQEEF